MNVAINYLAVLAAAVISFVVGGVWYSPMLFGNAWQRLSGRSQEEIKASSPKRALAGNFIATLITAYVLAHFVGYIEATTVTDALALGLWIWLGFVAAVALNSIFFEGKSKRYYLINVGYQLISLLVMSVILAMWQ